MKTDADDTEPAASTWFIAAAAGSPTLKAALTFLERAVAQRPDTADVVEIVGPRGLARAFAAHHDDSSVVWVHRPTCARMPHGIRASSFIAAHLPAEGRRIRPRRSAAAATFYDGLPVPTTVWRSWPSWQTDADAVAVFGAQGASLPLEQQMLHSVWRREQPELRQLPLSLERCHRIMKEHLLAADQEGNHASSLSAAVEGGIQAPSAGDRSTISLAKALDAAAHVPFPELRSDLCRLAALYAHGGMSIDLHAAWRRPVDEWPWGGSGPGDRWIVLIGRAQATSAAAAAAANADADHSVPISVAPWFTAATPRHSCVGDALHRALWQLHALQVAWNTTDEASPSALRIVDDSIAVAVEDCDPRRVVRLDAGTFANNFAQPTSVATTATGNSAGEPWRHHATSLVARAAWRLHFTIVDDNRRRTAAEEAAWQSWLELEPLMQHRRFTLSECYAVVKRFGSSSRGNTSRSPENENDDDDPQAAAGAGALSRLLTAWPTEPRSVLRRACSFIMAWRHGGVYAAPGVVLRRPLAEWFVMVNSDNNNAETDDNTMLLVIAPEPPGAGRTKSEDDERRARPAHTDIFAARRPFAPCLLRMLWFMDEFLPRLPDQHWGDSRAIPERVGPVAFGAALRLPLSEAIDWRRRDESVVDRDRGVGAAGIGSVAQCRSLPFLLSMQRVRYGTKRLADSEVAWRPRRIDPIRHLFAPLDPAPMPWSVYDAKWLLEEEGISRHLLAGDCSGLLNFQWKFRWKHIARMLDRMPFGMKRMVCSVMAIGRLGGFFVDVGVQWRQPLERFIPTNATMVLLKRRSRKPSPASGGPSYDGGMIAPFFFGATRYHPCMLRVLDLMDYRLSVSIARPGSTAASPVNNSRRVYRPRQEQDASDTAWRLDDLPTLEEWLTLRRRNLAGPFEDWVAGTRAFEDGLATCGGGGGLNSPVINEASLEWEATVGTFITVERTNVAQTPAKTPPRIPRRQHVVWRSPQLEGPAAAFHTQWLVNEPTYNRTVWNDTDCLDFARRDFPKMADALAAVPVGVMRGDVCRLLAVYKHGGVYMDLDVAWVRPLDTWLDLSQDIVVAQENTWHYCNWFFAAQPRHPCVARTLHVIADRIQPARLAHLRDIKYDFVHYATGPRAFTDGMRQCATPSLDDLDVTNRLVSHKFASTQWVPPPGVKSWRQERDELWKKPKPPPPTEGPAV